MSNIKGGGNTHDIKPVETRYKGYRFRSRLEARWAVFFDALGIEWEYEAEGYNIGNTWYLPDFWFPKLGKFAEIKPEHVPTSEYVSGIGIRPEDLQSVFGNNTANIRKIAGLTLLTGFTTILLTGMPSIDGEIKTDSFATPYLAFWPEGSQSSLIVIDDLYRFCQCPICEAVDICWCGKADRVYCRHQSYYSKQYAHKLNQWLERKLRAVNLARSARFEHGEKPNV